MSYEAIPDSWRDIGEPLKKELVDRIHENLEDLNNRATNLEGSVSTAVILNQKVVKERDNQALGTIVWSPLSLAQFQSEVGDGEWVLCNGGSCAGSDYGTLMSRSVVPDLRGRFIRMKDHGVGRNPDGDVDTDTAQDSDNKTHLHTINHGHAHTIAASGTFASSTHTHVYSHVHQWGYWASTGVLWSQDTEDSGLLAFNASGLPYTTKDDLNYTTGGSSFSGIMYGANTGRTYTAGVTDGINGDSSNAKTATPSATASVSNSGSVTNHSGNSGSTGLAESRPQNVTENAFIKINRNYITTRTGYFLWRAPQALTINQVIVSPVTQGTSGTLTIDIKKGTVSSQTTSIFTALPDMDYNDTAAQTGTLNATNSQLNAGDYIRVDVTTTQAKLQAFHILIAAAPT